MPHAFETNGAAIYRQSFATIRREAELGRFTSDEEPVVVRMVHAAGMVGLEEHIRFTPGMAAVTRNALQNGAPIVAGSSPRNAGTSRALPSRTRSKPWRVPTSVTRQGPGCAQPLAQPET